MANVGVLISGAQHVDKITITSLMLSNQAATLSGIPRIPAQTLVTAGGVGQIYNIDFSISSNQINWNSMGLGSVLSVGDQLVVEYFIL